jgi:hypothetical protein
LGDAGVALHDLGGALGDVGVALEGAGVALTGVGAASGGTGAVFHVRCCFCYCCCCWGRHCFSNGRGLRCCSRAFLWQGLSSRHCCVCGLVRCRHCLV